MYSLSFFSCAIYKTWMIKSNIIRDKFALILESVSLIFFSFPQRKVPLNLQLSDMGDRRARQAARQALTRGMMTLMQSPSFSTFAVTSHYVIHNIADFPPVLKWSFSLDSPIVHQSG